MDWPNATFDEKWRPSWIGCHFEFGDCPNMYGIITIMIWFVSLSDFVLIRLTHYELVKCPKPIFWCEMAAILDWQPS